MDFFPASFQINNPPSWRGARFCFEKISPHGPLNHAKKQGETTRTVQLSSERKCSTSGARVEDVDTLNGSLCKPSNTIVLPCNTYTYKSHFNLQTPPAAFYQSFVHPPFPGCWHSLWRKKRLSVSTPTLSAVSSALCAADTACPAAKTLNMPQQSDWVLKAGLHFNIQCTDSLTFHSSPE